MIYKIDGTDVTLVDLLLQIHDRYLSVEDVSFLDGMLTLGMYEKKWGKLRRFGTMTVRPVKSYFFKDSEQICFYSVNEFQPVGDGMNIVLNENNVVTFDLDLDIPTIELTKEMQG